MYTLKSHTVSTLYLSSSLQCNAGKAQAKKTKEESLTSSQPLITLDPTVCTGANILKNASDPSFKPDSEYPDWLWGLIERAESPKSLSQLSSDSKEYWRRYNKTKAHERNERQRNL